MVAQGPDLPASLPTSGGGGAGFGGEACGMMPLFLKMSVKMLSDMGKGN